MDRCGRPARPQGENFSTGSDSCPSTTVLVVGSKDCGSPTGAPSKSCWVLAAAVAQCHLVAEALPASSRCGRELPEPRSDPDAPDRLGSHPDAARRDGPLRDGDPGAEGGRRV